MDRLLEKLPLLIILLILFLWLLVTEWKARKRERLPEYTERARLVKTTIGVEQIGGRYQTENRHIDELVFETQTGEIVKVRAAWSTSLPIKEGAEGTLTWQGDRLVRFEQDEENAI